MGSARRGIPLILAVLLLAAAMGCAGGQPAEDAKWLWFTGDVQSWDSATAALERIPYGGEETVEGYLTALLAGPPAGSGLSSPFPPGVRLLGWSGNGQGLVWVDLSENYGTLAGMELTMADYCIILTLSQLEGVERVSITAGGQTLSHRHRQIQSAGEVLLPGAEEEPVEYPAVLCFPRSDGRGLGLEMRALLLTEDDVLAETVLNALLAGSNDSALVSLIPEGTEALSLRLDDGVCYVNLSGDFVEGCPVDPEAQALVIYSLVNTLGNLETVSAVGLMVEGETLAAYGEVPLPPLMEPDFGLVEP